MVKFVTCCAPDMSLPHNERQKEIDNYMKKRADYYKKCKEELIARKMRRATKKNEIRPRLKTELILDGIDIQCNECFNWRTLKNDTDVSTLSAKWKCCDGGFICQSQPVSDNFGVSSSQQLTNVDEPTNETQKEDETGSRLEVTDDQGPIRSSEDGSTSQSSEGISSRGTVDESSINSGQSLGVHDKYPVGSLVLVRFGSRPVWPALVEPDPNYNVHFAIDLESPCLSDPFDADIENEIDDQQGNPESSVRKNENEKLDGEEEEDLESKTLSDFIIDPVAYHVSLMGEPVQRIWIKKHYITSYSQKEAIKGGLCSFTNEFSLTIRNMQSQAIQMAEQVLDIPRECRVSRYGFMKRYKGPLKQEPDFESVSEEASISRQSVYLELTENEKEEARYDTERYLFGDYYFAPMEKTVPRLDQKGIDQLKELGIKMEPEM